VGERTRRELVPDEGMLKTGEGRTFRSFQGGHRERRWFRIMSHSLALIIPERPACSCVRMRDAYCASVCARAFVDEAHISPAARYSPSSGTPTGWHAAHMSPTRCTRLYRVSR